MRRYWPSFRITTKTPPTMTYKRGDIVYIPFRFTDRGKLKTRPSVVISSKVFHDSRDVVIAGVTGNLSRSHFVGNLPITDWEACGLIKPSAVSGIIQTIRDTQVRERVGALSADDLRSLDERCGRC